MTSGERRRSNRIQLIVDKDVNDIILRISLDAITGIEHDYPISSHRKLFRVNIEA